MAFSRAKAVVSDDYSHFRQILARATCWGSIRSVEALSFRYYNNELLGSLHGYNNELLGTAMSREAVDMARCFKNKMNEKYPEDLVDIDWDVNITRRIGY